jgi:hypothetical protein
MIDVLQGRHLKSDASDEFIEAVQRIEDTADLCYKNLTLLDQPKNLARWAVLTQTVARIEQVIQEKGFGTQSHSTAIQNLARWCSQVLAWISSHGKVEPASRIILRWSPALVEPENSALATAQGYDGFTFSFPLWHKFVMWAELIDQTCVRLTADDSKERRRIRAQQQGIYPIAFRPKVGTSFTLSPAVEQSVKNKIANLVQNASGDELSFSYGKPSNLWKQLHKEYFDLLGTLFRRQDDLSVGRFTLKEFRNIYSALLAICGVHDLACVWRGQMMGRYPINSFVLIHHRDDWIRLLQKISSVSKEKVAAAFDDLTFGATRTLDLFVHPFVVLNEKAKIVGLAPQFPLKSRPDENIIRVCSYLRPSLHDALTESKEEEMRRELEAAAKPSLSLVGPRSLPGRIRDIDLVVEDIDNSTCLIAELKWLRKTIRPTEHTSRQDEFLHATEQLREIKGYLQSNPQYLVNTGAASKSLGDYDHVHYAIIARDYYVWVDPTEFPVIDYDQFLRVVAEPRPLQAAIEELLRFNWLPVEGKDFIVRYDRHTVNGVSVESEVNYPTY